MGIPLRLDELHEMEQFGKVVLKGCSCEQHAMLGLELRKRLEQG